MVPVLLLFPAVLVCVNILKLDNFSYPYILQKIPRSHSFYTKLLVKISDFLRNETPQQFTAL